MIIIRRRIAKKMRTRISNNANSHSRTLPVRMHAGWRNTNNLEPPIKINRNEHIKSKSALVGNSSRRLHAILIVDSFFSSLPSCISVSFSSIITSFFPIGIELNVLMCSLIYLLNLDCVWFFPFYSTFLSIWLILRLFFISLFFLWICSSSIIQTQNFRRKIIYFFQIKLNKFAGRKQNEQCHVIETTMINGCIDMSVSCVRCVRERSQFPYCQFSVNQMIGA